MDGVLQVFGLIFFEVGTSVTSVMFSGFVVVTTPAVVGGHLSGTVWMECYFMLVLGWIMVDS